MKVLDEIVDKWSEHIEMYDEEAIYVMLGIMARMVEQLREENYMLKVKLDSVSSGKRWD